MRLSLRRAALGLALTAALVGCRTAALPLPDALDAAPLVVERPTVRTPGAGLRFGSYAAVDVDRSWISRSGARGHRSRAGVGRASYAFTFTTDGAPWRVACETNAHAVTIEGALDVALAAGGALDCTLQAAGRDRGRLRLRAAHDAPLAGTLTVDGQTVEVEGSRRVAGGLPSAATTGYHLRRDGRAVAAVETINAGRVWLGAALDEPARTAVAATAAALLLHEALEADLDEPPTASR